MKHMRIKIIAGLLLVPAVSLLTFDINTSALNILPRITGKSTKKGMPGAAIFPALSNTEETFKVLMKVNEEAARGCPEYVLAQLCTASEPWAAPLKEAALALRQELAQSGTKPTVSMIAHILATNFDALPDALKNELQAAATNLNFSIEEYFKNRLIFHLVYSYIVMALQSPEEIFKNPSYTWETMINEISELVADIPDFKELYDKRKRLITNSAIKLGSELSGYVGKLPDKIKAVYAQLGFFDLKRRVNYYLKK